MIREEKRLKDLGVTLSPAMREALWNKSFLKGQHFKPSGDITAVQDGRVVHIHPPIRSGRKAT